MFSHRYIEMPSTPDTKQITGKVTVNAFQNVRMSSTLTLHPFHRITMDVDSYSCRNNVRAKNLARKGSSLRSS